MASIKNKRYGVQVIVELRKNPSLATAKSKCLWRKVLASLNQGSTLSHNGQMDIVLDLWNHGYIR